MAVKEYSAWHTGWSFAKSTLRVAGGLFGVLGNLHAFAALMIVAELFGFIEELG